MVTAAVEYPVAIAASACRTSSAVSSRSFRAPRQPARVPAQPAVKAAQARGGHHLAAPRLRSRATPVGADPTMDAVVRIASIVAGEDFAAERARPMDNMGLSGLTLQQLAAF